MSFETVQAGLNAAPRSALVKAIQNGLKRFGINPDLSDLTLPQVIDMAMAAYVLNKKSGNDTRIMIDTSGQELIYRLDPGGEFRSAEEMDLHLTA